MKIQIPVPAHSQLIVRVGSNVALDDPILQLHTLSHLKINLANELGCKNVEIIRYLQKTITDAVAVGDLIAKKPKSWIFSKSKKFLAPVSGTIESISHETGEIIISHYTPEAELIVADFEGKIISIDKFGKLLTIELKSPTSRFKATLINGIGGGRMKKLDENSQSLSNNFNQSTIYLIENLTPLTIAQLKDLKANGCIFVTNSSLPQEMIYAQIKKSEFDKIIHDKHKMIFLNEASSEIILYK